MSIIAKTGDVLENKLNTDHGVGCPDSNWNIRFGRAGGVVLSVVHAYKVSATYVGVPTGGVGGKTYVGAPTGGVGGKGGVVFAPVVGNDPPLGWFVSFCVLCWDGTFPCVRRRVG